jgi:HK97 family phage prohead protease
MKTTYTAQSNKGFQFTFQIEKSIATKAGEDLIISGVASTSNIDHDNERMSESALDSMVRVINDKGVPLRWEHGKEDSDILGTVFQGHVDGRNQLQINARLKKDHPKALEIYEALKSGGKYGLSVGGRVMNATREMAASVGKYIKTFYDVLLDEVTVTSKPANYDAWLKDVVQKSMDKGKTKDQLRHQFLFENQQYDYLAQFAKSIPEDSWKPVKKLSVNNNKNMNDKDKKSDEKVEAEKSFVTKAQFDSFSATIAKAMDGLATSVKKALEVNAMDTTNPDKKKELADTAQVAKDAADGDDGKAAGDVPAKDQDAPDKAKEAEDTEQTAKAEDDTKDEEKEKSAEDEEDKETEKAEDGEKDEKDTEKAFGDKEDDEEATKSEGDDKLPKDLKAAMKSIAKATSAIETMTKQIRGAKAILKSEKVEKSQVNEIEQFAKAMSTFVQLTEERLEKSGKRVPGLAQTIATMIQNDPELQAELSGMMKTATFKKSRSTTPYMVSKDGRRFLLTASEVNDETVEKSSDGKPVKFTDLYKSKYSAIREKGLME